VKSLDTNILLYAINKDCDEHDPCRALIAEALRDRKVWVIAEQVWFELYRLLRNPVVLRNPLSADRAGGTVAWYREKSGWLKCAWEPDMMEDLAAIWMENKFPAAGSFDAVLAVTLKANGVKTFYTRNTKDFDNYGFEKVINPL
jgi:predicted nucleic acid-binding protein